MTTPRRDAVLVLARGDSRRMGQPKGLCRLDPTGPTLLEAVVALYGDRPVTVVTRPDLEAAYRAVLGRRPDTRWLALPPGDDTARTVLAAWAAVRDADRPTHVWLHPVDLPLLAAGTLAALDEGSRRDPAAAIRPEHGGTPGHPVVVPAALLDWAVDRNDLLAAGSMRVALTAWAQAGGRLIPLPVIDPGCVTDFDDPAALLRHRKDTET